MALIRAFVSLVACVVGPHDYWEEIAEVPGRYYCGGGVVAYERYWTDDYPSFQRREPRDPLLEYFLVEVSRSRSVAFGDLDPICRHSETYIVSCWNRWSLGDVKGRCYSYCHRVECLTCPRSETGDLIEDGE